VSGAAVAGTGLARRLPLLLLPLSLLPIAVTPAVPTQDGPSHLYNAWVLLRLHDPSLPLARHFDWQPFVPNWGGTAPLLPLLLLLPPIAAESAFHALVVLVWVSGCLRLATRAGGDPWVAGAAGGVLAHGFLFVMGFTGQQLTVGLGLWAAAWLAAWPPARAGGTPHARRVVLGCLMFAALFASHLAGAVLAAGLWTTVALARSLPKPALPGAALELLPPAVVPVLAALQRGIGPGLPDVHYRADTWGAPQRAVDLLSGGYWEALGAVDRLVGSLLVGLVALAVATRCLDRRSSTAAATAPGVSRLATALALTGLLALAGGLLLPWAMSSGAFVPDRLLPLALWLPLSWACPAGGRPLAPGRAAALALLVLALGVRANEYRFWGERQLALAEAVQPFPRGQLTLVGTRPLPPTVVDPFTHVWARIAIAREAVALDDYEARIPGLFPLAFRPATLALAERAAANPSQPPPGVLVYGWR
jgi:hypothetical protein